MDYKTEKDILNDIAANDSGGTLKKQAYMLVAKAKTIGDCT